MSKQELRQKLGQLRLELEFLKINKERTEQEEERMQTLLEEIGIVRSSLAKEIKEEGRKL